jgi:hypothetical protein
MNKVQNLSSSECLIVFNSASELNAADFDLVHLGWDGWRLILI